MGYLDSLINVSFLYKKSWKEWKTPGISHPHSSTPRRAVPIPLLWWLRLSAPVQHHRSVKATGAAWRNDRPQGGCGTDARGAGACWKTRKREKQTHDVIAGPTWGQGPPERGPSDGAVRAAEESSAACGIFPKRKIKICKSVLI